GLLPSDPGPAPSGIAPAAVGKLAVEAGEQPCIAADGELGAGVDARGIARGARTGDAARCCAPLTPSLDACDPPTTYRKTSGIMSQGRRPRGPALAAAGWTRMSL